MDYKKALAEEAIRLVNIPDTPDLYHRIRRFARVHLKHEPVAPIDTINWPKGCLMCGLMHMADALRSADNSKDRAVSILAVASVQDYLDRWIRAEAPLYFIDDVMAAQALLMLAEVYAQDAPELNMHYLKVADGVMSFLAGHDKDSEGVLPYRPDHKTGQIFADGIGMAVPFAIRYGLIKGNEDALELGINQITRAIEHLTDKKTGLPMHVYSLTPEYSEIHGASGWGRALGWIMYGLGASVEAFEKYKAESYLAVEAGKTAEKYLDALSATALKYIRQDGLFGSVIDDPDSPADTSATAMILYGIGRSKLYRDGAANGMVMPKSLPGCGEMISPLLKYITPGGGVKQAQGECMGIGIYSDTYGSYPWSVGMTMMLV